MAPVTHFSAGPSSLKAHVGGSSGASFLVMAESADPCSAACSCPDYVKRGPLCKHAAGLLLKVLARRPGEARANPAGAAASQEPWQSDRAARDLSEAMDSAGESGGKVSNPLGLNPGGGATEH